MQTTSIKKYLLLIFSFISFTVSAQAIDQKEFNAQPFHRIEISGAINVQITSGEAKNSLQLLGDSQSLSYVYAAVKGDTLYLSTQANFAPTKNNYLQARVNIQELNALQYTGGGSVTATNLSGPINVTTNGNGTVTLLGKNLDLRELNVAGSGNVHILGINSSLLNVRDDGSGKVNLGGMMVLQNLIYNGSGPLSIYWINSTNVNVTGSGQGRIFLAGMADLINATLTKRTYLDAKYLRAKRAFVNTSELSRADVWTKDSLNTLAADSSTIYYYNDSLIVSSYTYPPGSVIRMARIDANNMPKPPKAC